MNHQEKILQYKEKFKQDPLFRRIHNEGLEDTLFENEDYYSKVSFTDTYPSKKAAELLDMDGKEQTLLNYINRNDLGTYLNVYKQSRYYRYDWESLFKFKMLLLLSENKFAPIDIAAIIGTRPEVATTSESVYKTDSKENYYEIAKELADKNLNQLFNSIKSFEEYKEIQIKLNSEHTLLTLDIKLSNERLWSIQGRLDDLDGYLHFMQSTQRHNEGAHTGGVLSRLFKRKPPIQYEMTEGLSSFDEKKSKLMESMEATKKNKEELLLKLDKVAQQIDEMKQLTALSHFQPNNENERMINHDITPKLIDTN